LVAWLYLGKITFNFILDSLVLLFRNVYEFEHLDSACLLLERRVELVICECFSQLIEVLLFENVRLDSLKPLSCGVPKLSFVVRVRKFDLCEAR